MDPDVLMSDIIQHLAVIADPATTPPTRATHGEWLAERVEQLDTWLTTGGYLPSRWQPPRALTPGDAIDPSVEAIQRELDDHPTWRDRPADVRDPASPAYERRGTVTRDGYRGDRRSR